MATSPSTFASRALRFYTGLVPPAMPRGVTVMNPYADRQARGYTRSFLNAHFADNAPRVLVFGINPGRFGGGVTGVMFTDPVALADVCGVANTLPRTRELSSIFIYALIDRMGGTREFYRRYFLTAVSPLGFTRGGTNVNYYDHPALAKRIEPFAASSVARQIAMGGRTDHAIVLGLGRNMRWFTALNDAHGFFRHVHALEHPRWIMQYRRPHLQRYLDKYERVFDLRDR